VCFGAIAQSAASPADGPWRCRGVAKVARHTCCFVHQTRRYALARTRLTVSVQARQLRLGFACLPLFPTAAHEAAYRAKEGGPEEDLQWRKMRKGIADLHRRAEVSQKANERLLDALASVDDSRSVEELTAGIQKPVQWGGRRTRGLRPWGEDQPLLKAINHGDFLINGFRNRNLQALLYDTEPDSPAECRRRSSTISRKLRMLRAHGIVQKIPRTHRYQVTDAGRTILLAVLTTARTSVNQLNQLSIAA